MSAALFRLLCYLTAAMAFSACAPANISQLVEAMGKDPASICINVATIYGTAKIARTNISNGNVSCTQDGLSVKSDQPTVPLNVQVTPVVK